MNQGDEEFVRLVGATVQRFFVQNKQEPPAERERMALATRLWALVTERGLPRPLRPAERGTPGEMSDAECAPLVARVLGEAQDPLLKTVVRQLVKACLYPEFKTCRDSFREVSPDGSCRRQELGRVLGRVSGAHCVDCPYWVALTPEQHEKFLGREWRAGAAEFAAQHAVFLPEDFRALRRWLHARARANL
jgi:hypothetical protein